LILFTDPVIRNIIRDPKEKEALLMAIINNFIEISFIGSWRGSDVEYVLLLRMQ